MFIISCIALGYLGAKPAEGGYLLFSRIFTAYYFIHFLVVMPIVGVIEKPKKMPNSITESVLGEGSGEASPGAVGGGETAPAAPENR